MPTSRPSARSRFFVLLVALLLAAPMSVTGIGGVAVPTAAAADPNPIVAENALQGNPASEWDVSGAGDASIQGFATDISVNRGSTIDFKIDTSATAYDVRIYRLGYYGGAGARLVTTIPSTAVTAVDQPGCSLSDIPIGAPSTTSGKLLDCGNWSVSASWAVPSTATSGVYIARPTRLDNGGASHIPFIVRDDAGHSDLLFQTSDTTWQSYNVYGGYNAYGSSGATMAEKLSYNRPFTTRGAELENYLFNAEYPMIRWLERNGYDVAYSSAVDTERHANLIANHKVFMSVGHDEYWSQGRRDAVTAARDAGVNLAFFSGNEVYWKTRWEASTADGGSTDYQTQVVYKEGNSAPSGSAEHRNCYDNFNCDPSPIWTGQWRQAAGSTPENSLSGQISWRLNSGAIAVPSEYAPLRFWRNTEVANLTAGQQVTLADTLGYEWDPESPQYADYYPAGRVLLSTTDAESSFGGPSQHHMSLYRAGSGALVFGAGTVQWPWALDGNHDRGTTAEDRNVQQATVNLFADMGVQPATRQSNLVAATASTDTTPPTVTVTSPASGASVPGGAVTITGTASDVGGVVGVVEISTDGGTTWRRATGRESWSYTYTAAEGPADIRVRAADDSARLSTPITHAFTVEPRVCPCSIWPDTAAPASTNLNDNQAGGIEVGVKFRAGQDGYITGLRYYWAPGDAGTHSGNLWTGAGALLASAVFPTPTTQGWQNVTLDAPVPIVANTTYVASQHSSAGNYPETGNYFGTAFANAPLTALADGTDGPNGVYKYGASGFPTTTYQAANYWVDVVYATTVGPDTTPPTIVGRAPAPGATSVQPSADVTVTFGEPIGQATLQGNVELRDATDAAVAATLTYDAPTRTATLDPDASLAAGATYSVLVRGGATGIADLAGNRLAVDSKWSFTVAMPSVARPDPNVGPGGPVLVVRGSRSLRLLSARDPAGRGPQPVHRRRHRDPHRDGSCLLRHRRPRGDDADCCERYSAHRLGQRRRQPGRPPAGCCAGGPPRPRARRRNPRRGLHRRRHGQRTGRRHRRRDDAVPRDGRLVHGPVRHAGRRHALQRRDDRHTQPGRDAAQRGHRRWLRGSVRLRPRQLDRPHPAGQPGLGRYQRRRQQRAGASRRHVPQRHRSRLGEPQQSRDPAGGRAAAPARQRPHRDDARRAAAAALLVPAARREGRRGADRRHPQQQQRACPLR